MKSETEYRLRQADIMMEFNQELLNILHDQEVELQYVLSRHEMKRNELVRRFENLLLEAQI